MKIKFYYHKDLYVNIGEFRQIEETEHIINSKFKYTSVKIYVGVQRYEIDEDGSKYYLYNINVELLEK